MSLAQSQDIAFVCDVHVQRSGPCWEPWKSLYPSSQGVQEAGPYRGANVGYGECIASWASLEPLVMRYREVGLGHADRETAPAIFFEMLQFTAGLRSP